MLSAGLPRRALNVVGAVRHRDDHSAVIERGGHPQTVSIGSHDLAMTFKRRLLLRRDTSVIQNDRPVACRAVVGLKLRSVFEANAERGVGDSVMLVIRISARGKTGDRERDRRKQA